MSFKPFKSLWL